jgi:tRNA(Leu) C34 or U34 (ribose-2'-O)-methylase TrmL
MVEFGRDQSMRGYFGIGAEGISKPMNLGNLIRSAHAFGASFVFLVDAHHTIGNAPSDTSHAEQQLPLYCFEAVEQLSLPKGCALIGVELLEQAIELPSFRHPLNAAYVFGPERSSLSPAMVARCDHVVRIPPVLHQSGGRRRHRHVRSHAEPRALCTSAGALRRPDRAIARARPRQGDHALTPGGGQRLRPLVHPSEMGTCADQEEHVVVIAGRIDRREQQGHHLPDQLAETRIVDAGHAVELAGHRAEIPPCGQNTATSRVVAPRSAAGTCSGARQASPGNTICRLNRNTARYCGRALEPGVVVKWVGCRKSGLSFNMSTSRLSSSA